MMGTTVFEQEAVIVELQTKLAFQDDLLEDLNKVVTEQQHQIMRMNDAIEILKRQVTSLQAEQQTTGEAKEPPPPHY